MAQVGRGFTRNVGDGGDISKGYHFSEDDTSPRAAVPVDRKTAPDSPMDVSASVASPRRFPRVQPADTRPGLTKSMESLRVAPHSTGEPAPRDTRTLSDTSTDSDGGASGSAASPSPSK